MDLTEEQIEAVVNWMNEWDVLKNTSIPLRFKEAFTKSKISVAKNNEIIKGTMTWGRLVEYLTQGKESNADIKKQILQQIVEKIYDDMKLPLKSKLKMDYDDEDDDESDIKIGDRVKLKGDSNSPEMTVTADMGKLFDIQNLFSKEEVKQEPRDCNSILECSRFDADKRSIIKYNFHRNALKKLTEVQSINDLIK